METNKLRNRELTKIVAKHKEEIIEILGFNNTLFGKFTQRDYHENEFIKAYVSLIAGGQKKSNPYQASIDSVINLEIDFRCELEVKNIFIERISVEIEDSNNPLLPILNKAFKDVTASIVETPSMQMYGIRIGMWNPNRLEQRLSIHIDSKQTAEWIAKAVELI